MFNLEGPRQNVQDLISAGKDPYSWVTTRNYVYEDKDGGFAVDGLVPDVQDDNGTVTKPRSCE